MVLLRRSKLQTEKLDRKVVLKTGWLCLGSQGFWQDLASQSPLLASKSYYSPGFYDLERTTVLAAMRRNVKSWTVEKQGKSNGKFMGSSIWKMMQRGCHKFHGQMWQSHLHLAPPLCPFLLSVQPSLLLQEAMASAVVLHKRWIPIKEMILKRPEQLMHFLELKERKLSVCGEKTIDRRGHEHKFSLFAWILNGKVHRVIPLRSHFHSVLTSPVCIWGSLCKLLVGMGIMETNYSGVRGWQKLSSPLGGRVNFFKFWISMLHGMPPIWASSQFMLVSKTGSIWKNYLQHIQ